MVNVTVCSYTCILQDKIGQATNTESPIFPKHICHMDFVRFCVISPAKKKLKKDNYIFMTVCDFIGEEFTIVCVCYVDIHIYISHH